MTRIAANWLRVEYVGESAVPAKLVVPLILDTKSRDIRITITPRSGVKISASVETGDALKQTFTKGWSGSVGASFFGAIGYERSGTVEFPSCSVFLTPDFKSVVFALRAANVDQEMGVQLAFPVEQYEPNIAATAFAEISLEVDGAQVEMLRVPQEVHPRAANILIVKGFDPLVSKTSPIATHSGPFIATPPEILRAPFSEQQLLSSVAHGSDILHIECSSVEPDIIYFDGVSTPVDNFFDAVDQGDIRLIYFSSCNSVQLVNRFRRSTADALIAATENLWEIYADLFERAFYESISLGDTVSEAFRKAVTAARLEDAHFPMRSRQRSYSPMFLDLKAELAFGPRPPSLTPSVG